MGSHIDKTASQLTYFLQAAMGQCSTLPAEARGSSSVASRYENIHDPEQRHRLRYDSRKESLNFDRLSSTAEYPPRRNQIQGQNQTQKSETFRQDTEHPQARDPDHERNFLKKINPMNCDARDEPVPIQATPPPPSNAVRQRCYKLNLDSEFTNLSSSQRQQLCLGPFSEPPPMLTYSSSEDSSTGVDDTIVAMKTAQIFRGITIGRDGAILSQNARATRNNRGSKQKRSEKSRQAAKIDKAKDLVEETLATGKAPDSDDPVNMVSLFIVGQYDDMKHLVRDGSKKLRDADGLPDETLYSTNLHRSPSKDALSTSKESAMISPRKRASPHYISSQRTAAMHCSHQMQVTGIPYSAPPKLKSHPRDTQTMRREEYPGPRMHSCNNFEDSSHVRGTSDGADWTHAWNLWNCGVVGAASPVDTRSPRERKTPIFEGRDSHYNTVRENGGTRRAG